MHINSNIEGAIARLNSLGEQFDFKITNDRRSGQNLNALAPSTVIEQI
ncbi:MAG: hypothetical protein H9893_05750 [Candidatus Niameybacter stercoravium]|nr:hypothetical protein [Candidatus Niameybacter stercoravium]